MTNKVTEVTQLTVPVSNQPGVLSGLLTSLGTGINLEGISAESSGDASLVRLLVGNNPTLVIHNLQDRGFQVLTTPAFVVELSNTPGSLVSFIKEFSKLGINIRNIYSVAPLGGLTSRIVFTADNPVTLGSLLSRVDISTPEPALA